MKMVTGMNWKLTRKIHLERLKIWSKKTWLKSRTLFTGLVVLLAALVTIFPDQREIVTSAIYGKLRFKEDSVLIDHLTIDSMRPGEGFSFCPGGFFVEVSRDATAQQFARVEKDHDVTLRIRKNPLLTEPVLIKDIYVNVEKVEELNQYDLIADMNCGAGMNEKLFYIDESDYIKSGNLIIPSRIKAKIHPENEQQFDFIVLNEDEPVDSIRVFIPSPSNTLLRFSLEIVTEVAGTEYVVETEELAIARTDEVDKWNEDEEAVWEIESPAKRSADYERFWKPKDR